METNGDRNDILKGDIEYEKYLLKVRKYLEELGDSHDIEICQRWIEKLTSCAGDETSRRNECICALCHQLSNGIFESPFSELAPEDKLLPYPGNVESRQCNDFIIDLELLPSELNCNRNEIDNEEISLHNAIKNKNTELKSIFLPEKTSSGAETVTLRSACASSCAFQISESPMKNTNTYSKPLSTDECQQHLDENFDKSYEYRANNLIIKFREMKKQNNLLKKELLDMKTETSHIQICQSEDIPICDLFMCDGDDVHNTSTFIENGNHSLAYFTKKIMEMENFRYFILDTLDSLEEKFQIFEKAKKHDINEIILKHKIEFAKIRNSIRDELKEGFEKDIKQIKKTNEDKIKQIELNHLKREQEIIAMKDEIINEKEKLLSMKDMAIVKLEKEVEEQRNSLITTMNTLFDKTNSECGADSLQNKIYHLERCLAKAGRSKNKCIQAYENRVAQLKKEKYYLMRSFQMQLIRQKIHKARDVANDTHSEVNTAVDRLESKYKEVIASMQATAIKRRMQDQLTLELILQATCGITENHDESLCFQSTCSFNQPENLAYIRLKNRKKNSTHKSSVFDLQNVSKSLGEETGSSKFLVNREKINTLDKNLVPQKDLLANETHIHQP